MIDRETGEIYEEPQYRIRRKLVDDREPATIRTKLLETGWHQVRIASGDYLFQNVNFKWVCITRKTISDLIGSIGKNFSKQLEEMIERYEYRILLLEGKWISIGGQMVTGRGIQQWRDEPIRNFLRTWQDRGITLEFVGNEGATIRRLNELFAYYMRDHHAGGVSKNTSGDSRLMAFGQGIGPKIGKNILKEFGSLRAVANAEVIQLQGVKGMGQKRAEGLWNHFNRSG